MQSNMKKTLLQNYIRYENISIPQTTATDSQKYFIWPRGSNVVFCYCIVFFRKICEAIKVQLFRYGKILDMGFFSFMLLFFHFSVCKQIQTLCPCACVCSNRTNREFLDVCFMYFFIYLFFFFFAYRTTMTWISSLAFHPGSEVRSHAQTMIASFLVFVDKRFGNVIHSDL